MYGILSQTKILRLYRRLSRQRIRRYMTTHDIRRSFIEFFEKNDHVHVPSSSLLPPHEDRSLLFTNAGMNQFKPLFLGSATDTWISLKKAVSYQKCLRAGGKHSDLEVVGSDLHHQTFFEMLGNWSFNNSYSKEEACKLAWHFLTDVLQIDQSRLYVTYFGGSDEWNIPPDYDCKEIWLKIGLHETQILPFARENFWEMGPSGPCGPCTEIHYDRTAGRCNAANLVNSDPSLIELWNIVFISLLRSPSGRLEHLPSNHIDTGMGLERLASVMQNVPSNFDIDVFVPIIRQISSLSKVGPYKGNVGKVDSSESDASYRILADHLRAIVVAIADGIAPSATDAGFIIRKMLRRVYWHAVNQLKIDRYACAEFVPIVIETLKPAYFELRSCGESVAKCILEEELQYWEIVDKGCIMFEQMRVNMSKEDKIFSGENAWILHDTHGIPIEITENFSKKHGLTVDIERFNKLKDKAKMLSRSQSKFSLSVNLDTTGLETHKDSAKYTYFIKKDGSYDFPSLPSKVLATYSEHGRVQSISSEGMVVVENCQFFAEEGGQKCDVGVLEVNEKPIFGVTSVVKINGVAVLCGNVIGETVVSEGLTVNQKIDVKRREALMRAHTATHLLNWALRRIGAGEGQRGSSISEDSLRFDYATGDCAGEEDVVECVESLINNVISEDRDVTVECMPLEQALNIHQLQSEIKQGKKYPQFVRVVRIGNKVDDSIAVECCSGTHVLKTSSIGDFTVISDRSSAKGIRRMVAFTGNRARDSRCYGRKILSDLSYENDILDKQERTDTRVKKIAWDKMPYLDNIRGRELMKLIKKKRKTLIA